MTLVDFGQTKVTGGKQGSKSNSTKLYTIPGDPCRAPANGVVVLARNLALTGNTVVIDHGCGMRSYLYGLDALSVSEGQSVERGQAVGALGEDLTHGLQARQQERESVAALPDQRRAVLERKWINKRDCCTATVPFVIESLRKWRPRPTSSGRRRRLPVRCGAHRRCRWPAPASVRRTTRAGRGSSGPSGR